MGDKLWKALERWVGKNIFSGASRNPCSGRNNKTDEGDERPGDVIHPLFLIECKLRDKISIFRWWDKLKEEAAEVKKIPILVIREKGDLKDVLVVVHYTFFKELLKGFYKEGECND